MTLQDGLCNREDEMTYKTSYGLDVSVEIITDTEKGNKLVKVLCPMYMSKEFFLPFSYSVEFSDYEILNDRTFSTAMLNRFPSL